MPGNNWIASACYLNSHTDVRGEILKVRYGLFIVYTDDI